MDNEKTVEGADSSSGNDGFLQAENAEGVIPESVRRLYPHLTEKQLIAAAEGLRQYLLIVFSIFEHMEEKANLERGLTMPKCTIDSNISPRSDYST